MISGCEEDFATNSTGRVDTLYLGTKDTVYKVDTIKTITVIEEVDTILKVTIDSIIKVDTVTTLTYDTLHVVDTLFIDTGYHIDTLYITDTTKYYNDTVYSTSKTVFALGVEFVTETEYALSIRSSSFQGEIPTLVHPSGEFKLDQSGALFFVDTLFFTSVNSEKSYTIVSGKDTLRATYTLGDYMVDSLVINDTTFYRNNHYASGPWNDTIWKIEYDFTDPEIAISWDNDSVVERSFSGSSTTAPEWLDQRYYDLVEDTVLNTEENTISFSTIDPMIEKITATFTTQTGSLHGMKPHASSKSMESYLIVNESLNKVEIIKPREWMDALFYIGPGGWTQFEDQTTAPLTLTKNQSEDTLHSIEINKSGSGYAIAHGRVGDEDSITTLRKLKQIYIRYTVDDETDTVSLGLTAGITTSTDSKTWSTFRAVLTSGCRRPGYYTVDILDMDDFYISWDDGNFPLGTTLADVMTSAYKENINSITIAPETGVASDTTFGIEIHELYFAGDYGMTDEAIK